MSGLRIRDLDTIKFNKPPSSNTLIFFHNYYDCLLFESFLYHYFEKDTLFAIGDYLLWDLYNCLADCCHIIKESLDYYGYHILAADTIFFWNKVPGIDNNMLLLHLEGLCNLESIDLCRIEKNNDTITIKTSTTPIILRLDRDKNEAIIMFKDKSGQFKYLNYNITINGSDILVGKSREDELLSDIVYDIRKRMQQIICDFVHDLSLSASNSKKAQEFSYYCKILSQDKKFMATVEDIYKNRHVGFEKGYHMLTTKIS